MAPKHATRDALATYLKADTQPRPLARIQRYMAMMHGVKPAATREALHRLCKAGLVRRTEPKFYLWVAPVADSAETLSTTD